MCGKMNFRRRSVIGLIPSSTSVAGWVLRLKAVWMSSSNCFLVTMSSSMAAQENCVHVSVDGALETLTCAYVGAGFFSRVINFRLETVIIPWLFYVWRCGRLSCVRKKKSTGSVLCLLLRG